MPSPGPGEPRKATRPRDAEGTRAALLDAAQVLFSTRGYAHTGVREVAERCGVNPALVIRYFGSKEGLFRETLERSSVSQILGGDRRRFGRDLMEAVLGHEEDASSPIAIMMLSAADPAAHAASVDFLRTKLIAPLAEWLGPPDGAGRAARISILWMGFLTNWKLLPIEPLAPEHLASTRRWLETTTQAIVDEGER